MSRKTPTHECLQVGEPTYWQLVEGEARVDLPLVVFEDFDTWTALRFAVCGAEVRMQHGDHPVLGRIVAHSIDIHSLTAEVALVSKCGSEWFLTIQLEPPRPDQQQRRP